MAEEEQEQDYWGEYYYDYRQILSILANYDYISDSIYQYIHKCVGARDIKKDSWTLLLSTDILEDEYVMNLIRETLEYEYTIEKEERVSEIEYAITCRVKEK